MLRRLLTVISLAGATAGCRDAGVDHHKPALAACRRSIKPANMRNRTIALWRSISTLGGVKCVIFKAALNAVNQSCRLGSERVL